MDIFEKLKQINDREVSRKWHGNLPYWSRSNSDSLIGVTAFSILEIQSLRAENQKLKDHLEKMREIKGTPHD